MNERETLKKVKKIEQKYKRNLSRSAVVFMVTGVATMWFVCQGILGEGFKLGTLTIAIIGAVLLMFYYRNTRSIQKEARSYAAEQLLFPTMQENFQIYEFQPGKVIPKYMAEKSELLPVTKAYDGYGYTRASYRGAMFICSNVSIKTTNAGDDDTWKRAKNRYKRNCEHYGVIYEGMLARVDLNLKVDGFLKIEELHSSRGVFYALTSSLQEKIAKANGVRVYDFSAVNPEFHKHFKVTASDEWFAQQVLTQEVMNGLLKTKTYSNGHISLHFTQDDLYISNKHGHVFMAIEDEGYCQDYLLEDARYAQGDVLALVNILDTLIEQASFAFFKDANRQNCRMSC